MKRILLLIFLSVSVLQLQAQQDPLYAQYMNTPMIVNPAYAGFKRDLNLAVTYRKQWAGFDGSPQTFNVSGHMALHRNKMGAGLMVVEDKIGSNSTTEMQGVYGYHLALNAETTLSFGLQFGAINYRTDYSSLIVAPNDPKLGTTNEWQPNFGSGLILTNNVYFISLSVPKMLVPTTEMAKQGLYNRNLYLITSYFFPISSRVSLKPYAMLRTSSNSDSSYDIGVNILGDDSYSIGIFTRKFHTYGLTGQLKLGELLALGYAFELPTSQSAGAQFTTHELQVILRFKVITAHDLSRVTRF